MARKEARTDASPELVLERQTVRLSLRDQRLERRKSSSLDGRRLLSHASPELGVRKQAFFAAGKLIGALGSLAMGTPPTITRDQGLDVRLYWETLPGREKPPHIALCYEAVERWCGEGLRLRSLGLDDLAGVLDGLHPRWCGRCSRWHASCSTTISLPRSTDSEQTRLGRATAFPSGSSRPSLGCR